MKALDLAIVNSFIISKKNFIPGLNDQSLIWDKYFHLTWFLHRMKPNKDWPFLWNKKRTLSSVAFGSDKARMGDSLIIPVVAGIVNLSRLDLEWNALKILGASFPLQAIQGSYLGTAYTLKHFWRWVISTYIKETSLLRKRDNC